MSKIIGVTVGTPLSPQTIKEKLKPVLSVNDKKPNANGNVDVAFTLEELTEEQKASLKGDPGADGKDGVSATHSWNGTTLTIKSASGTSSADLKGDKGDKGETGPAYTLTKADKAEMVADVIAALPVYDGSVTSV